MSDHPSAANKLWRATYIDDHLSGKIKFREHEGIVSGCEVNRLIAGLYGERLPSIDLAHVDLSRGELRPE